MTSITVVGGGPSLKKFPWSRLKNVETIAVNRAYVKLPTTNTIYFSDVRFWEWFRYELVSHPAEKITCSKIESPHVTRYAFSSRQGPVATKPATLKGGNSSGYAAINLAIQRGAKTIYLLGFDMRRDSDQSSNWHNDYPTRADDFAYTQMLKPFAALAPAARDLGVEIINVCPDSAIEVFPKISVTEYLALI